MSRVLVLRNEQKTRGLDLRLLRKITLHLLTNLLDEEAFELGFRFVASKKMSEVNETFLQHSGSTDVITFDYAENGSGLHGEVFICIEDAIAQAKEFSTTWQSELVRYVVHAILHLQGYDDLTPVERKKMKVEENRLVKILEAGFPLRKLAK
ncbi:MAG: putative metal-dependent hydrolase [Verrucomicrobiales bacterium]|nr:putative metal-dependent hydrolase [Verrucomicrobiales bacterium]